MERSIGEKNKYKASPPIEYTEPENSELTERQKQLFCIYYVKSFNATMSAIKAGYFKNSAYVEGPKLLGNPRIKNELSRLKSEMTQPLFVSAMDILNKYAEIVFADINDFVDFGHEDVPIYTKKGTPVLNPDGTQATMKQSFVALRNADEVDGSIISEVKEGKDGVSVKLHDKMKALEKLEQYFDLLPDHHKRKVEEEKLKLEREKVEIAKAKASGDGDNEDELVDDWVSAVVDDAEIGQNDM